MTEPTRAEIAYACWQIACDRAQPNQLIAEGDAEEVWWAAGGKLTDEMMVYIKRERNKDNWKRLLPWATATPASPPA